MTPEQRSDIEFLAQLYKELNEEFMPRMEAAVTRLLESSAPEPNGSKSKCAGCGQTIWFVYTPHGKLSPVNRDGLSHFATCPEAERFRKRKRKGT